MFNFFKRKSKKPVAPVQNTARNNYSHNDTNDYITPIVYASMLNDSPREPESASIPDSSPSYDSSSSYDGGSCDCGSSSCD